MAQSGIRWTVRFADFMKQVSLETIKKLALTERKLEEWTRYTAVWWVRDNAQDLAKVGLGLQPSDNYGRWPKGWKREMERWARAEAEKRVLEDFMRDEVLECDGAYWLTRPETIERASSANVSRKRSRPAETNKAHNSQCSSG